MTTEPLPQFREFMLTDQATRPQTTGTGQTTAADVEQFELLLRRAEPNDRSDRKPLPPRREDAFGSARVRTDRPSAAPSRPDRDDQVNRRAEDRSGSGPESSNDDRDRRDSVGDTRSEKRPESKRDKNTDKVDGSKVESDDEVEETADAAAGEEESVEATDGETEGPQLEEEAVPADQAATDEALAMMAMTQNAAQTPEAESEAGPSATATASDDAALSVQAATAAGATDVDGQGEAENVDVEAAGAATVLTAEAAQPVDGGEGSESEPGEALLAELAPASAPESLVEEAELAAEAEVAVDGTEAAIAPEEASEEVDQELEAEAAPTASAKATETVDAAEQASDQPAEASGEQPEATLNTAVAQNRATTSDSGQSTTAANPVSRPDAVSAARSARSAAVGTAAPTADAGPVVDGEPGEQLWMQVRRAMNSLRTLENGSQQVTLRLRPAELGTVMVRVSAGENSTAVSLVADSAIAASQLNQERQTLVRVLEESGLMGVAVDVGTGGEADQSSASSDDSSEGSEAGSVGRAGSTRVEGAELAAALQARSGQATAGSGQLIDLDL